jgi:hypothetical protein
MVRPAGRRDCAPLCRVGTPARKETKIERDIEPVCAEQSVRVHSNCPLSPVGGIEVELRGQSVGSPKQVMTQGFTTGRNHLASCSV